MRLEANLQASSWVNSRLVSGYSPRYRIKVISTSSSRRASPTARTWSRVR